MGVVYDAKLRRVLVHSHAGSDIDGDVTPALPVTACSNVRCLTQGTTVRIKWSDPEDLQVDGVTLAVWARTVLVRKAGGYPANAEDGTVVVSNTTRNAYNSTAFVDTLPDGENTYYYRLCPASTKGVYNLEDANRFVAEGLTWATVVDVVRSGEAQQVFGVGDTFSVEHSTYGTINFEVAGFDLHTPTDTTKTHSMTLLCDRVLATMQFDAAENQYALTEDTVFHPEHLLAINIKGAETATMFAIEDKAATGTARVWYSYNGQYKLFWHSDRWEVWTCSSATHVTNALQDNQSTAAAEPTAGTWSSGTTVANAKVYYTYDGTDYNAATVSAGDTVTANSYYEKNPHDNRVSYGYNNWQYSGIRQWLNSSEAAGAWWQAQHIWDKAPSNASNTAGFLAGITDAEFLAAIGEVELTTARNTICDCGGSYTTHDKVFLASQTEIFGSNTNNIAEGTAWPLYVGAENADRIKYLGTNAQHWFLRSPYVGNSHLVYFVTSSGSLYYTTANNTIGAVPACVIC